MGRVLFRTQKYGKWYKFWCQFLILLLIIKQWYKIYFLNRLIKETDLEEHRGVHWHAVSNKDKPSDWFIEGRKFFIKSEKFKWSEVKWRRLINLNALSELTLKADYMALPSYNRNIAVLPNFIQNNKWWE